LIGTFVLLAGVVGGTRAWAQGPDTFQIVTPEIDIPAGAEISYCYYFRTSNVQKAAISRWVSELGPATLNVQMFLTTDASLQPVDKMPPGTLSTADCGYGTFNPRAHWVYAAYTPLAELPLPADGGDGRPLANEIPPNSAGFLKMLHVNATGSLIKTRVTITAEALDRGTQYTPSAAFATYNGQINIGPNAMSDIESQTCAVPQGAQFWRMSTHAHKQAVRTAVLDGPALVFESMNWEQPGAQEWPAAPFFTFASGALTWECTYNNPTTRTIRAGDSAATDEQCMAIGQFFPACFPTLCFNSFRLSAPCLDLIFEDGFDGS
jgi:hypothetical protein